VRLCATRTLAVSGIVRRFGDVAALAGVDLAVHPGELVTILGPSGSGKTTLLKIIAGSSCPTRDVRLKGEDITFATPAKRGIGMVFQNYALFPHLTVEQNVAFPLEMRSVPRAQIRERSPRSCSSSALASCRAAAARALGRPAATRRASRDRSYSTGTAAPRRAVRRARPQASRADAARGEAAAAAAGLTALFVTHDQEEALVLSDRIAVMSAGRIEQLGHAEDIYALRSTGSSPISSASRI
jgi:ABC-type Fe3+/spermidine/putrescine transport system ATPase subunit